ncbi:MAG TPA: sugar phosphate nucleotidyltransferase [Syntrophorhabdaceae bacterium]|jgi:glucose-1-phosphate adenylyltransferase
MRDTITMLLAGGVGSRLNILVSRRAKPAVPFGGIYRIIDFTLSNIANSGLTRVAVLTQYKPLSLMDHIGNGSSWDLTGRTRSIRILPPKTGETDWDWYRGTADAVRQNIEFLGSGNDYKDVLILSGDHVYAMDYRLLIEFHRERAAKVTIGMIEVPWIETPNFGIGIIDSESRIIDWEEKPKKARSNLASMGIYVFDRDYLLKMLKRTKEEDFGHHIIPNAMKEGSVYAYLFTDYWRDVGTVQAYWDANMDLLDPNSPLEPEAWRTRTNVIGEEISFDRPPICVTSGAEVSESAISPGCVIEGRVEHSVLSPGVLIAPGAMVKDSVIMHDTVIKEGARLYRCIVDKHVIIGRKCTIGMGDAGKANAEFPEQLNSGLTLVGRRAEVPDKVQVGTNCILYPEIKRADFEGPVIEDGSVVKKLS